MSDALLERMGQMPYQYEFITNDQEVQHRILRNEIERQQNWSTEKTISYIENYEKQIEGKDNLHTQYILMKRAQIAAFSAKRYEEAEKLFRQALACTGIHEATEEELEGRLFTLNEMDCLYGLEETLYVKGEKRAAFDLCTALKKHMDNLQWDYEEREKYYPQVLYRLALQETEQHNPGLAYEYLMEARQILIETFQSFHLAEICELLQYLQKNLEIHKEETELDDFVIALKILESTKNGEITEDSSEL